MAVMGIFVCNFAINTPITQQFKRKIMSGLEDNYGAEIGMRVTCKRCGTNVFMKQTGYNNIDAASKNRHSFLDQFEPMPDG